MPNMIDNIVGIVGPYDRLAELCHAAQKQVPASGEINITVCRKTSHRTLGCEMGTERSMCILDLRREWSRSKVVFGYAV